jgi:putative endonuclease
MVNPRTNFTKNSYPDDNWCGGKPSRINCSNMCYVYVLKSRKDQNLYIGSTNDLNRRLNEHNAGLVFSTKTRVPFGLVYYEAYKSESDARNREKNLKIRSRAFAQLKKRIKESLQK